MSGHEDTDSLLSTKLTPVQSAPREASSRTRPGAQRLMQWMRCCLRCHNTTQALCLGQKSGQPTALTRSDMPGLATAAAIASHVPSVGDIIRTLSDRGSHGLPLTAPKLGCGLCQGAKAGTPALSFLRVSHSLHVYHHTSYTTQGCAIHWKVASLQKHLPRSRIACR